MAIVITWNILILQQTSHKESVMFSNLVGLFHIQSISNMAVCELKGTESRTCLNKCQNSEWLFPACICVINALLMVASRTLPMDRDDGVSYWCTADCYFIACSCWADPFFLPHTFFVILWWNGIVFHTNSPHWLCAVISGVFSSVFLVCLHAVLTFNNMKGHVPPRFLRSTGSKCKLQNELFIWCTFTIVVGNNCLWMECIRRHCRNKKCNPWWNPPPPPAPPV